MITTRFLFRSEYKKYSTWLKQQDQTSLYMYFGVAASDNMIDSLVNNIVQNPDNHHFLVAELDNQWVGTIHIAAHDKTVEFGFMVGQQYRGQGIANQMLEEALIWARNRGYQELFMHCLERNSAIQHLCKKHNLKYRNMYGDVEVSVPLSPATLATFTKEIAIQQRNVYYKFLQNARNFSQAIQI